ncbi:MAG: sigma-70 family RNA polymerase sigma factor [Planctomycetes bacterium]|nr:sigma-70 family RNA polymerase sigma factor [Planctomycetota bacterium]
MTTHTSSDAKGFAATHWTVVMTAARGMDSSVAAAALTELCQTYWYPLYAFLRRRGHETHEAEDLTQAFFAKLLGRDFLATIDREKGRFRSFLLASLKNFLADERDRVTAQKRGGGQPVISLDGLTAESRYRLEPAQDLSPEMLYEKQWALSVLERVLSRLQSEAVAAGRLPLFEHLQATLIDSQSSRYATIASELGMTEGAVKSAAHRFRQRYRELLIDEISLTVSDHKDVDGEIRYLMACL